MRHITPHSVAAAVAAAIAILLLLVDTARGRLTHFDPLFFTAATAAAWLLLQEKDKEIRNQE